MSGKPILLQSSDCDGRSAPGGPVISSVDDLGSAGVTACCLLIGDRKGRPAVTATLLRGRVIPGRTAALLLPLIALAAEAGSIKPSLAPSAGEIRIVSRTRSDRPDLWRVQFEQETPHAAGSGASEDRSVGGVANVDCGVGRYPIERFSAYRSPHLRGEPSLQVGARPEWRTAPPDTTLRQVQTAVCAGVSTLRTQPGARPLEAAAASLRANPGSPGGRDATAFNADERPRRLRLLTLPRLSPSRLEFRPPGRSRAQGVRPRVPTDPSQHWPPRALRRGLSLGPPTTRKRRFLPHRRVSCSATQRLDRRPSPPQPPSSSRIGSGSSRISTPEDLMPTRGAVFVQVEAATTPQEAKAILIQVLFRAKAVEPTLQGEVAEAIVHEKRYYRVLLGPIGERARARRLCSTLLQQGQACFVRPATIISAPLAGSPSAPVEQIERPGALGKARRGRQGAERRTQCRRRIYCCLSQYELDFSVTGPAALPEIKEAASRLDRPPTRAAPYRARLTLTGPPDTVLQGIKAFRDRFGSGAVLWPSLDR